MKNKHQKGVFLLPRSCKNKKSSILVRQIPKKNILISILFFVHFSVNFAAILDFFFKMHSSVSFSTGPLIYNK